MKRNRTKPFAVNTIIMANLAFLALLFFQFALPPEYDEGIKQRLPRKITIDPYECGIIIDRENIKILVNRKDQLLVEGQLSSVSKLYGIARKFYTNPDNSEVYPYFRKVTLEEAKSQVQSWQETCDAAEVNSPEQIAAEKKLEDWQGRLTTLKAIGESSFRDMSKWSVITIDMNEEASFGRYIEIMSELRAAMNDLRNEYSWKYFGKSYEDLDPEDDWDKLTAIYHLVPNRIVKRER